MASYTVLSGDIGSQLFTAVASTVDTVTFADDLEAVEVVYNGADIWVTLDGSTPTVGGTNSYWVANGTFLAGRPRTSGGTVVKVISSGTPTVRVQRGD